jgi:ubiquinone/menaquinone biosynthesis C-methylase UbiE
MAAKNDQMNRLAVELLEVKPDDRILEIGFGSGTALASAAAHLTDGRISGVDVSDVMVGQARHRNRRSIEEGRVDIKLGSALRLPYPDSSFDKVFAVNNFHLWADQQKALREIRRVLNVNGMLLLPLRHKHPTRRWLVPPGFTQKEIDQVIRLLELVGFRNIQLSIHYVDQGVTCIRAYRP